MRLIAGLALRYGIVLVTEGRKMHKDADGEGMARWQR